MIHWTPVDAFKGDIKKMELEIIKQSKRISELRAVGNGRRINRSKQMLVYAKFIVAGNENKPEIRFAQYDFDYHDWIVSGMTGNVVVTHFAKSNEPCE